MIFISALEDDFLLRNLWWIVLASCLILLLIVLLTELVLQKKKREKAFKKTKSLYLQALGGKDNIIRVSLLGSRIVLQLRDYSHIDQERLKEAGVDGFIQKSDKLTLVVTKDPQKVYDRIFHD